MNKLNQNGWGLGVFVAFIGIFFIAIIMIVYVSNKYNVGIDKIDISNSTEKVTNTSKEKYEEYEGIVKERAIIYQELHYPNISNGEILYTSINNLDLPDEITNECTGYVEFKKYEDIYYYSPYISCGMYRTKDYNSKLDK